VLVVIPSLVVSTIIGYLSAGRKRT